MITFMVNFYIDRLSEILLIVALKICGKVGWTRYFLQCEIFYFIQRTYQKSKSVRSERKQKSCYY